MNSSSLLTSLILIGLLLIDGGNGLRTYRNTGQHQQSLCPPKCSCFDTTVDCSNRLFFQVPRYLPLDVETINLRNNKIDRIEKSDFRSLKKVRNLFLSNNRIYHIEKDSFKNLIKLENLHLDNNSLVEFPEHLFPKESNLLDIRFEHNKLIEIPSKAFSAQKRLQSINLSNNRIEKIAPDAFHNLPLLNSLTLYKNKINKLPSTIFRGLSSLKILLLNANEITCVQKDLFKDLHNLMLLSLYDNKITTLINGTFNSLEKIKTLHLAKNQFFCDCKLEWLPIYLNRKSLSSGAKCADGVSKRLQKRKIQTLEDGLFKCNLLTNDRDSVSSLNQCGVDTDCPEDCFCDGHLVDCSFAKYQDFPRNISFRTTDLSLKNNNMERIRADGFLGGLVPNVKVLDLSHNAINLIEENAFEGASLIVHLNLSSNNLQYIGNKMFMGLYRLEKLILNHNQISCLMAGSLDSLTSIKILDLTFNKLICDCHSLWFFNWLKLNYKNLDRDYLPSCYFPVQSRNQQLLALAPKQLHCSNSNDFSLCANSNCPQHCSCLGTIVRCSAQKLSEIPVDIPIETTELYLDNNLIKVIDPSKLNHLKFLTKLDLSNNSIEALSNNSFWKLSKLSNLNINYNRIECIETDALKGLQNLKILSLYGNQLSLITEESFVNVKNLTHVVLGNNPLYCDCSLKWLSEWIKKDDVDQGIAKCTEPLPMENKLILYTESDQFECKVPVRKEVLAKCNKCIYNPCKNEAKCLPSDHNQFQCICLPGYYGKYCDLIIDACYGNPCVNNGSCLVLEEGRFGCQCPKGFSGDRCEINVDDCPENHCQHNSTCVDGLEDYVCQCMPGYTGRFCENKISFCTFQFNPCANGAECIDNITDYYCKCPVGFVGKNCSINKNDCENHMCQNGATCIDGTNDYVCECPDDYTGRYCEISPLLAMMYPQSSPCQNHDCVHGVCFQPNMLSNDYVCKCSRGFSGKRCEYVTTISFSHNNSFVELEPLLTEFNLNITIVFSTTQPKGVLMYEGVESHLAAELFKGRIRISYNIGNYPVSTMYSFETVNDGNVHVVELLANGKNFTLRVDGGLARSIINEGVHQYLNITAPLFLGGIENESGRNAIKLWHLRDASSFKGCFHSVWINKKIVDFENSMRREKTAPGCVSSSQQQEQPYRNKNLNVIETALVPITAATSTSFVTTTTAAAAAAAAKTAIKKYDLFDDYEIGEDDEFNDEFFEDTNPCTDNKCNRKGTDKCYPTSDGGYACHCKIGFKGQLCEKQLKTALQNQNGSCRKKQYRMQLNENGCKSKKAIRLAKCVSAGGHSGCCCEAQKTKKRRVQLKCSDGARYLKDIDIVTKCSCKTCRGSDSRKIRSSHRKGFNFR